MIKTTNNNILGIGFLVLAMFIFSLQDITVKLIGGSYPILEIVIFRTLVAIPATLLFYRMEGGRGLPTTKRPGLEYLRGFFYFLSYIAIYMALASLQLADISAIRFSTPLMITILSVMLLGEKVGLRNWAALVIGFLGVLFIVQPGTAGFNIGSIFVLLNVLFYALAIMVTRRLQTTDSSATMAYYSSLFYMAAAIVVIPLTIAIGPIPHADASIAFLFRAWSMPTPLDLIIMIGLGLVWTAGMFFTGRAYSLALASVAAPFEYVSLPISIMWGFLLWKQFPSLLTLGGAGLTLLCSLYTLYAGQKDRSKTAQVSREAVLVTDEETPLL